MTKKIKIIVSIICVVLLGMGGFLYQKEQNEKTPSEKWSSANYVSVTEYKIEEVQNERVIKYEKTGLEFKIPLEWAEGWSEDSPVTQKSDAMVFYSPDTAVNPNNQYFLTSGCKISNGIFSIKTDVDALRTELSGGTEEVTSLRNYKALKKTIEFPQMNFYEIDILVPIKDKLYTFILVTTPNDKEKCEEEFGKFLETVSIE